jgi:predicted DNA-binding ribbon-helix-helix protein
MPALKKRSVVIQHHRTSVSLEAPFWQALKEIASARGLSLNNLIAEIDRGRDGNLSSALRLFVLETLRRRR